MVFDNFPPNKHVKMLSKLSGFLCPEVIYKIFIGMSAIFSLIYYIFEHF